MKLELGQSKNWKNKQCCNRLKNSGYGELVFYKHINA